MRTADNFPSRRSNLFNVRGVVLSVILSTVTYEEFKKMDLRLGKVVKAEKIAGRDKILKLTVDIGGESRQMIAGGAEYYGPEYFEGRKVVVLANLQPKKIAGVESWGMMLAATHEGKPFWLTIEGDVPSGSRIE